MGTLADLAESGDADALSAAIADGAHLDEADDEGNTATHKAAQGEPATRPKIRAVREDFGTAPEDFGSAVCCIIKFRTTWRRVSLFFLSLFV